MDCTHCPSCRLGVSSGSGRLRWCVPEKGTSRRLRFVVTAVVLLLVLTAIGAVTIFRLSSLYATPSAATSGAEAHSVNGAEDEPPIRLVHATGLRAGPYDGEGSELEKPGLPYMTTEFAPPPVQPSLLTKPPPVDPPRKRKRRRRRRRRRKRDTPEDISDYVSDLGFWDVILNQTNSQEVFWPKSGGHESRFESASLRLPLQLTLYEKSSNPGREQRPAFPVHGDVLEELDWNPVPARGPKSHTAGGANEASTFSSDSPDGNADSYNEAILTNVDTDEDLKAANDDDTQIKIEPGEANFESTDDYENLLRVDGAITDVGENSTSIPLTTTTTSSTSTNEPATTTPTTSASSSLSTTNAPSTSTTPASVSIPTLPPSIPATSTVPTTEAGPTATNSNTVPTVNTTTASPAAESVQTDPEIPANNEDNHAPDMNLWGSKWNATAVRNARARTMLSYMDESVNPCTDFYQYACGNWAKRHAIPADKAAFDTFEMLRESLNAALRRELEAPAPTASPLVSAGESTNALPIPSTAPLAVDAQTKAKHFYRSCMDHDELSRRGSEPLLKLLGDLGGWPVLDAHWNESTFNWVKVMGRLRLYNNDILVSQWVGPDIKNSDQYVIQLDQASLGLPSRDYFLVRGNNAVFLSAYKEFIVSVASILGAPPDRAARHAEDIVNFETSIAMIMLGPEERRNVSELYTRMPVSRLISTIPGVDWDGYLSVVLGRNVSQNEPIVVFAERFLHQLVQLMDRTPKRIVADYMLWRFARHRTNQLDDRFASAKQRLYRSLFGREAEPPRWKTCVANVNSHMGMPLGAIFVQRYFDQTSKEDTVQMTKAITAAFREMLGEADWMDNETRKLAARKLDAMQLRIGYPDFIVDHAKLDEKFDAVEIRPDRFFENTLNILQHVVRTEQARLGTPVNKSLWNTPPAIVNAYYSRNKNQIMFPAGILQPPFYHRHLPRSLNYGGIGVVIGHEMTHGFDDKGRLFDEDGNLRKWWDETTVDGFRNRAQCLVDQYSNYKLNDLQILIDGESTQGENIADNSGVKQAFRVYDRWLREHGPENETLPGVPASPLQLFFLNFAQVWCGTVRPQAMRSKMKTAVHAPGPFRVVGTLSNSREFSEVFNCPIGSPMNPSKKCSVW